MCVSLSLLLSLFLPSPQRVKCLCVWDLAFYKIHTHTFAGGGNEMILLLVEAFNDQFPKNEIGSITWTWGGRNVRAVLFIPLSWMKRDERRRRRRGRQEKQFEERISHRLSQRTRGNKKGLHQTHSMMLLLLLLRNDKKKCSIRASFGKVFCNYVRRFGRGKQQEWGRRAATT